MPAVNSRPTPKFGAESAAIMERRKTISQSNKSRILHAQAGLGRSQRAARCKFVSLGMKWILPGILPARKCFSSSDILSSTRRSVRYQVMYLWGGI